MNADKLPLPVWRIIFTLANKVPTRLRGARWWALWRWL